LYFSQAKPNLVDTLGIAVVEGHTMEVDPVDTIAVSVGMNPTPGSSSADPRIAAPIPNSTRSIRSRSQGSLSVRRSASENADARHASIVQIQLTEQVVQERVVQYRLEAIQQADGLDLEHARRYVTDKATRLFEAEQECEMWRQRLHSEGRHFAEELVAARRGFQLERAAQTATRADLVQHEAHAIRHANELRLRETTYAEDLAKARDDYRKLEM
jgi:hypothetical protein